MVKVEKSENQAFLEKSIHHLEATGFEDIKADMEGYETPKSYLKKGSDISITPDIVAEKEGKKHYFDISLKSDKPKLLKSKWLFLNALTALKSYRFKLITTKGHYKFTYNMLDDINLNDKKLIKI